MTDTVPIAVPAPPTADGPQAQASSARPPGAQAPAVAWRRPPRIALWLALGWLVVATGMVVAADLLPLADPDTDVGVTLAPPFESWPEFLGTDGLGRSHVSRIVYGGRVSLAVGVSSALIGSVLGGTIGILAGYSRRRFDAVVGILTDAFLAFPALILLIALVAVLEPSITSLIAGLSLVSLPTFVRLARANTLRFLNREFVLAARAIGARPRRIILRELVPNVVPPVASYVPLVAATLIIAESSLSYLGVGIRPPTPSWGIMISSGQPYLRDQAFLVFVPATVLFLTVSSIGVVGEWLRSRFDVAARKL